jgi:hypothetical protein
LAVLVSGKLRSILLIEILLHTLRCILQPRSSRDHLKISTN